MSERAKGITISTVASSHSQARDSTRQTPSPHHDNHAPYTPCTPREAPKRPGRRPSQITPIHHLPRASTTHTNLRNGERLGTHHRPHRNRHLLRRSLVPRAQRREPNGLAIYSCAFCRGHVYHVGDYFSCATSPAYFACTKRFATGIQWWALAWCVCGCGRCGGCACCSNGGLG